MPFDYKKEYREFYLPPKKPHLITIPRMNFVAVHGKGDPNAPGGAYQEAMGVLYGIAFTIKMSYKGSHKMDGYFEYVVPPLEGLWHQKGVDGVDYAHKETFEWTSMIRLPEFVTPEAFDWAVQEATAKKKKDFSKAEFLTYDEGLCIQCLHIGPYDEEPKTLAQMDAFYRFVHIGIIKSQTAYFNGITGMGGIDKVSITSCFLAFAERQRNRYFTAGIQPLPPE